MNPDHDTKQDRPEAELLLDLLGFDLRTVRDCPQCGARVREELIGRHQEWHRRAG